MATFSMTMLVSGALGDLGAEFALGLHGDPAVYAVRVLTPARR